MKKINIPIVQNSYNVYLGMNELNKFYSISDKLKLNKNVLIVSDKNVYKYWQKEISGLLRLSKNRGKANLLLLNATERLKSFNTTQNILAELLKYEYGRDTLLIAIGGGIVGDIVGFAAAIFSRGIQYVQVPTTLLAAVDSSVGGKTGINFAQTKNIIGAFKQPEFVLINTNLFNTLPKQEMISGLGEVIKYAYLTNDVIFKYISENINGIIDREQKVIEKVITESVRFKGDVVVNDEKEAGTRKMLNLGHTFAHAFEVEQNHKIKHGHAVIVGIACAIYLSLRLNLVSQKNFEKLIFLMHQLKHLVRIKDVDHKECITIMKRDKKNRDGKIKFVLIKDIGNILLDVEASNRNIVYSIKSGISIFK